MNALNANVRNNKVDASEFINSIRAPNQQEQQILNKLLSDSRLVNHYPDIPWNIKIFDADYEYTYPHTHHNIILIHKSFLRNPDMNELKRNLAHEKVHVFQKMKPFEFNKHLLKLGYNVCCIDKSKNRRNNPDINRIKYHDQNGSIISSDFNSIPQSLTDTIDKRDHPYEILAYKIASKIIS